MMGFVTQARWERFCGVVMAAALLFVLFGTIVFVRPSGMGGPMSGAGDGLAIVLWVFGMVGMVAGFLQQAEKRTLLINLGLGWSIIALFASLLLYQCPFNEMCERDSDGNGTILLWCVAVRVVLHTYDTYQEWFHRGVQLAVRGVSLLVLLTWIGGILAALASAAGWLPLR